MKVDAAKNALPQRRGKAGHRASELSGNGANERPILFSGPMVKAMLEGRKTQTRRVLKAKMPPSPSVATSAGVFHAPGKDYDGEWCWLSGDPKDIATGEFIGDEFRCPYGKPGDRLWVREGFAIDYEVGEGTRGEIPPAVFYRATDTDTNWANGHTPWQPSIFMPRWASRITLDITDVRVERLQEISEADAIAEGVLRLSAGIAAIGGDVAGTPVQCFEKGWDAINGKRAPWASNPWVWVVSFQRASGS